MSNFVFVETGQCGNQLGFALLDSLYSHLNDDKDEMSLMNMETFFHHPSSGPPVARAVCLDTEPKVINESLQKANKGSRWRLHPRSVAYRHGGAGNNWALGYEMASGEFLETAINLVRRELEHCDASQTLVFMHSVAGGTGSGLGTRMSEACEDEFHQTTRVNIAVAPYHFGEVVVQHYNALLCLSKISAASHGTLIFENEIAQMLCKTMKGIERPSLSQLNDTIVANICPMFLPKHCAGRDATQRRSALIDDVTHLCAHPGYKFLDIKVTPQTSNKSVDFTYDTWSTLLKTIQQMQLSGAASERNIKAHLKHALQNEAQTNGSIRGASRSTSLGAASVNASFASTNVSNYMNQKQSMGMQDLSHNLSGMEFTSPVGKQTHSYKSITQAVRRSHSAVESPTNSSIAPEAVVRSLASVVTLYGEDAPSQLHKLQHSYDQAYCPWRCSAVDTETFQAGTTNTTPPSKSGHFLSPHSEEMGKKKPTSRAHSALQALHQQQQASELQLHELYYASHSPLLAACGNDKSPVKICASKVTLNGYQRSTSVLANSQAVLPLLQRAARGGAELYEAGAYLHQYSTYGIEEEDFLSAFRSVGNSIQNYLQL